MSEFRNLNVACGVITHDWYLWRPCHVPGYDLRLERVSGSLFW